MTRPAKLHVELNSLYPRWTCYVHDGVGTANGGFWRGFKSHDELDAWLAKNGYSFSGRCVNLQPGLACEVLTCSV